MCMPLWANWISAAQTSADQHFHFLKLADDLYAKNVHQTYLQLEAN